MGKTFPSIVAASIVGAFFTADAPARWPVAPVGAQHPIRGSFLDPRGGYHWGVDINVRDDRPERGHPRGRTHRVYAMTGGTVSQLVDGRRTRCSDRSLQVGRFAYWHVDAVVRPGQRVRTGQMLGWTCKGLWHVHLGELAGGWVNPLRAGGALSPYRDTLPPVVREVDFYDASGRRLEPSALSGRVDVRARISDPQSFRGWMVRDLAFLASDHHPYRVHVRIGRPGGGSAVVSREVFRADRIPAVPAANHYAPGTKSTTIAACLPERDHIRPYGCQNVLWFHLFGTASGIFWDTRAVPNGSYRLRVTAWDTKGNRGHATVPITISN